MHYILKITVGGASIDPWLVNELQDDDGRFRWAIHATGSDRFELSRTFDEDDYPSETWREEIQTDVMETMKQCFNLLRNEHILNIELL